MSLLTPIALALGVTLPREQSAQVQGTAGVPAFDVEFSALVTFFTHVDRGLLGCRYGSARPHRDIPLLVELYKQGRLMLDELVSATYPLERFDTVVADLHDGKLARGVLQF